MSPLIEMTLLLGALLGMGLTLKAGVTPTLKLSREEWKHRAEFSAEWGTGQ